MKNQKRTALITGGARGIGRAVADKLSDCGFNLLIVYKTSRDAALQLVSDMSDRGIFCMAAQCDAADPLRVEELYRRAKGTFGFVDTLVNNAGVSLYKLNGDCRDADYSYVMDNNFRSVFNLCRAFSGDMVSGGFGRIVNISSVWAHKGAAMEALYAASKAAVTGYTKALAKELGPAGITVNAVSPGFIDTDMTASFSDADRAAFFDSVPLGRAGLPAEVADAVELLVREKTYLSGADIRVDGGL